MTSTTIGQRIAERRKLLNLSQEALGEKMGVSRQAISKWEADAAVPEIDKLIAMSKLFSVPVGWLLGTEEAAAAEPRESFTEEQLKMVEEIVKRYHQPQQMKAHLTPAVVTVSLLLLAAVIAASALLWNYVNQQTGGIWSQLTSLYTRFNSIEGQLGDMSDKLDELAQGEKLLSEYTLEASAWEDMSGATVSFTAIPKNTRAGDQAWLSVRLAGEEVANAMCTGNGSAYSATVDLPAADGYSYYFQVVHTGGDSSQQVLTDANPICKNLNRALAGTVYGDADGWGWSWGEEILSVDLSVQRCAPDLYRDDIVVDWTQIDLVLLRNGEEIDRMSILDKFFHEIQYGEDGVVMERLPDEVGFSYEHALPGLTDEDTVTLQLEYRFSESAVSVRPIMDFSLENGRPQFTMQ